ncbi:DinB family protein [Salmonirosea aquatica]|uniref:Damage-inducible protein DinB n=1 Tax=Salmonirosea aquatica TaxID=2654236 RepID=A0A7C9BE96_9BACT|nr:damage-inducible protein DinB [Cytophagaceae bacterium SJW1-29]
MKEYLLELARYNVWANAKLSAWLSQISVEQWKREFGGSFKSLEATALHIVSAEKIWFERLEGKPQPFLSLTFQGDRDEVLAIWKSASANLERYLVDSSEESLREKFTYRNLKGNEFTDERSKVLAHVFNHSTYHRGQLVNYLREVGFTAIESTDLINFYRLNE